MKSKSKKFGFSILGIILLGVVAIFVLSYFKISIKSVVESPTAQENVGYVTEGSQSIWDKYLKKPAEYIWNEVFINLLWDSFVNNMQRVKNGQPTEIQNSAPSLPN